jgi:hypothetical protein
MEKNNMDTLNIDLQPIEIYPHVFVYKNLFNDIEELYSDLKESSGDDDGLFSPWSQWSQFGEYLNPIFKNLSSLSVEQVEQIKPVTPKQERHRLAILELFKNFYKVTEDYAKKNHVDLDINKTVLTKGGDSTNEWRMTGPSIARYRTDISDPIAMAYHSDYIREPITSPGYKFAITALTYFNDDYVGGEIDFIVNGEAYMYKPEAGDFLVFPSGHPEVLTKDGCVYIHGVMPATGANKYLARMYWTKYSVGDEEWFAKEEEFGKDVWAEMQPEIMQKFRDEHPNKMNADKEKRIK